MTPFFLALVFLAAPNPGRCWSPGGNPQAVLWVPEESFSNWAEFSEDFLSAGSPGMTLALTPEQLTARTRKILEPLIQSGKLEIAARIAGDPILPLIASNEEAPRPQDALDLLSLTREEFEQIMNFIPAGYAPGGGAVSTDLFPAYKSMSLGWVAVGDYPRPTGQWASFSGVVLAPLHVITAGDLPGLAASSALSGWDGFVVDEADGLAPEGSMLEILRQAASVQIRENWSSVSDAVAKRQGAFVDSAQISQWPTWAGDYSLWNSSGPSQNAWSLYAKAALDLEQYQNSGSADLRSLEKATGQLHKAQAGWFFQVVASSDPVQALKADQDFRKTLRLLYQDIDEPSPNALYTPIVDISSAATLSAMEQTQELSTDVTFDQGPSWISFENPPQSLAYVPQSSGPAVVDINSPWKISSLRIDWSTSSLDFTYQMGTAVDSATLLTAMGRLVIDTYIDINHIAGAGSTQLLPGRNAYTEVADAWEYALSLDSKTAFLYRSSIDGSPQLLSQVYVNVAANAEKPTLTFSVPQSLMPGDPRRWGYITISMASDQSVTPQKPAPLWSNPGSSVVLSLLAPLESQKSFFADPLLARLAALRAPLKKNPLSSGN